MSDKTRKKKNGRRKDKKLVAMRDNELKRHLESGLGYSVSRGAPHRGHTTHPQGPKQDHQAGLGKHRPIKGGLQ